MSPDATIYLNEAIGDTFLFSLLSSIVGVCNPGNRQNEIETPLAKITLERNPYASDPGLSGQDAFLRYPCRLVIETKLSHHEPAESPVKLSPNDIVFDSRGYEPYIKFVSDLLKVLWGRGISAVAACDFEHMLPENGGIDHQLE